MPQVTLDNALSMLRAGSLDTYNEDCADVAVAFLEKKAPTWATTGCLRTDSPIKQLLELASSHPADLADGFHRDRQDVLEYLTAKRALWELGVSLAALGLDGVRNSELQRLTTDQFWKSHYLLYLCALLRSKSFAVEFVKEEKYPTPDIKVGKWYVECKERNCGTPSQDYFGAMFKKSKDKFNRSQYRPGIVAYDIVPDNLFAPSGVPLEEHYKQMARIAFVELAKLKGVDAIIITIRRLLSRNEDKVGFPTVWMCLLKDGKTIEAFRETWSKIFHFIWTGQDIG